MNDVRRDRKAGEARGLGLRERLVAADVLAVSAAWIAAFEMIRLSNGLGAGTIATEVFWVLAGISATLVAMRSQQLYVSAVSSVRSMERHRLGRAVIIAGVAVYLLARAAGSPLQALPIVAASALAFSSLGLGRSVFRAWLAASRRAGRYVRPVVLVGVDEDGEALQAVLREHPEVGFRIVGAVTASDSGTLTDDRVGATVTRTLELVRETGATGVLLVAGAVSGTQLNPLVRVLLDSGVHVHMSVGLRGISHQRVRSVEVAHEPLLYLERSVLSRWQLTVKRAVDLSLATAGLLFTLPVLIVVGAAIKLHDGGPLLFRQERVGRDGKLFNVYKLRTMVVDAEARLEALREDNEREHGPLFKLTHDPRVTPIGRFLRASSLDELPQFLNVIQGTMSLVGPRPALPAEVEQFDAELRQRTTVKPGVTGLWQVEARDNPSFGPYRRLDLFYVENWSVGLDLSILAATAAAVAARAVRLALPNREHSSTAPSTAGQEPLAERTVIHSSHGAHASLALDSQLRSGTSMTAARPSSRRFHTVTIILTLGALLLTSLPAAFAAEGGGDATQERLSTALSVHGGSQLRSAAALGDGDGSVSAAQTDTTTCFNDAAGDTRQLESGEASSAGEADITRHCASYGAQLDLRVTVADPTNPTEDENWEGGTFLTWLIETTGDDEAEYFAEYHLDADGDLFGQVSNIQQETPVVECNGTATFEDNTYILTGIGSSCLGGASSVRLAPGMFYDAGGRSGTGPVHYDIAPNSGGFEAAVARQGRACPSPSRSPFADRGRIATTHRPNVDCLYELGVALGQVRDGQRYFMPRQNINRGQFAGFLFRALEVLGHDLPPRSGSRFSDVPANHTFDEEIHRLATAGIITGFGDGTYRPGATIRRDQTATLLTQALEKVTGQPVMAQAPGTHFRDTDGNVHEANIDAAFENNLISGTEAPRENRQGLYSPRGRTDRQRMASVLRRFIDASL